MAVASILRALALLVAVLLHSVREWFRDSRLPQWDEPRDRRLHLAMGELYGWHCAAFAATDVWLAGREMRGPISGAGQIRILHRIKT